MKENEEHKCSQEDFKCYTVRDYRQRETTYLTVEYSTMDEDFRGIYEDKEIEVKFCPFCGYSEDNKE